MKPMNLCLGRAILILRQGDVQAIRHKEGNTYTLLCGIPNR